jgi:hypothetical protein
LSVLGSKNWITAPGSLVEYYEDCILEILSFAIASFFPRVFFSVSFWLAKLFLEFLTSGVILLLKYGDTYYFYDSLLKGSCTSFLAEATMLSLFGDFDVTSTRLSGVPRSGIWFGDPDDSLILLLITSIFY